MSLIPEIVILSHVLMKGNHPILKISAPKGSLIPKVLYRAAKDLGHLWLGRNTKDLGPFSW